jgi:hypothetical protein
VPVHAQAPRRLARVAAALPQDPLDMLPADALDPQRRLGNGRQPRRPTGQGIHQLAFAHRLREVVVATVARHQDHGRAAVVSGDDHDPHGGVLPAQLPHQIEPLAV